MMYPRNRLAVHSKRPPARLAVAVASALLLGAIPVQAAALFDSWGHAGELHVAWGHPASTRVDVSAAGASDAAMGAHDALDTWKTTEFNAEWGLAAMNAHHAYARGLTGGGIRLGVFDSGTDLAHAEFAGKRHRSIRLASVLADGSLCAAETIKGPDSCFMTDGDKVQLTYQTLEPQYAALLNRNDFFEGVTYNTHGTHVGGTIAANRDGTGMHGVAFGAEMSVARLFSNSLSHLTVTPQRRLGQETTAVQASASIFTQLYEQLEQHGARAVNHSWGLVNEPATPQRMDLYLSHQIFADQLAAMTSASRKSGLIQVWAAGNTDATASPDLAPIAGMYATVPRAHKDIEPYWLAVVNVNEKLELSNRSMRCGLAADWCVAAPGTEISSTTYGPDTKLDAKLSTDSAGNVTIETTSLTPDYDYEDMSGTSMAAPHVTGALGLLFERFPYLDNAQVRDVLLTTTRDLGAPGKDEIYGHGLVDLHKAIEGYGWLRVDTDVVMNQKAGGLKVWDGDAWDDWTNDISGAGRLTKSGVGWLRLSGNNSFNGAVLREGTLELNGTSTLASAVEVDGGAFVLNGALVSTALRMAGGVSTVSGTGVLKDSDLLINGGVVSFNGTQSGGITIVGSKGILRGTGTLGDTSVAGIIAPGNSIGTLTINGNYVQAASGSFLAELAPGGRSDQLRVTGTATLDGALVALPEPGVYYLGEQINVLHAEGGVVGRFVDADFSAFSPFLKFSLGYSANTARVDVSRGELLATAASTPNQRAVAGAADTLAVSQGLPQPLTLLFPAQVGAALDGLSGELHAATPMVLLEGSRHVRDAALSRGASLSPPGAKAEAAAGAWLQGFGGSGKLDGDYNTAHSNTNTNGVLIGVERQFGNWQLGALVGNGRTDVRQQDGRRAKAEIDSTHLGAYAGRSWGGFGLRGGVAWSKHEARITREVAFAGFTDTLSARQDARTRQVFVETGYRFGGREAGLEPYLQVARVAVDSKRINEQGGAAALTGEVRNARSTLVTGGFRFDKGLRASFHSESWLHVRGGVGYRQAFGDRSGVANLVLANSGTPFAVDGAPIAKRAVVAELGLTAWLSSRQRLELGYSGQFGDGSHDQGIDARWSINF